MRRPAWFKPDQSLLELLGFSDSNYADGKDKCWRATTGYCFFLCGILIAWKAKRQDTTACSTYEAELIAAYAAFLEGIKIMDLLKEMQLLPEFYTCPFFCDNEAVVSSTGKPPEDWTKNHLNTKFFRCAELVRFGVYLPRHIDGVDNCSDIFTKVLKVDDFRKHRNTLLNSALLAVLQILLFATYKLKWIVQFSRWKALTPIDLA